MSDRDLLAKIHSKAAIYLSTADISDDSGVFEWVEEIWNMTQEAWDQVHGPSGDDGRDFTPTYEP